MKENIPLVKLGGVLKRVERFENREENVEYQFAGTYSFARGIFVSGKKDGSSFRLDKIQRVHEGDFVYCKIMAWEGAFGLVPTAAHNAVMSGAFVVYQLDRAQLDPKYLNYYFKIQSVWRSIGSQSTGTNVRRRSLHPKQFEDATIPLPPLSEQQRIVGRIEELAGKIEEARGLRRAAAVEAEAIMGSARARIIGEAANAFGSVRLEGLCTIVRGSSPRPKGDSAYYGGPIPRLLIADITRDGKYVTPSIDSLTFEGAKLSRPMTKGSLVIAISGSYGLPAFLAVDACIHDGFIGFRSVNPEVDIEYLYHSLMYNRPYFDSVVKNSGLQNLTTSHLRSMVVPFPPLPEQHRIVEYLDDLQAKVDAVKKLQAETAAELDAMLPSVLDRAFRGDL